MSIAIKRETIPQRDHVKKDVRFSSQRSVNPNYTNLYTKNNLKKHSDSVSFKSALNGSLFEPVESGKAVSDYILKNMGETKFTSPLVENLKDKKLIRRSGLGKKYENFEEKELTIKRSLGSAFEKACQRPFKRSYEFFALTKDQKRARAELKKSYKYIKGLHSYVKDAVKKWENLPPEEKEKFTKEAQKEWNEAEAKMKKESPQEEIEEFNAKKAYVQRVVFEAISKHHNKQHANYGMAISSFAGRIFSGVIGTFFIATDFANIKRLSNDDPKAAKKEYRSKFRQDLIRVALTGVVGYFANELLKERTNKSLVFAVALNAGIIFATEIVSRVVTGRRVLPNLTNTDKKDNCNKTDEITNVTPNRNSNTVTFKGHLNNKSNNKVSFKSSAGHLFQRLQFSHVDTSVFMKNLEKLNDVHKEVHEKYSELQKIVIAFTQDTMKDVNKYNGKNLNEIKQLVKTEKDESGKVKLKVVENEYKKIKEAFEKTFKGQAKIPTDRSYAYKITTRIVKGLLWPIQAIGTGLKFIGEKLSSITKWPKQISDWYKNRHKNTNKMSKHVEDYSAVHINNIFKVIEKMKKDKIDKYKNNFSSEFCKATDTMNPNHPTYDGSQVSTYFKLTGMVSVPFFAIDAYNTAKGDGKNERFAKQKGKDRTQQDLTRQGISFWANKTFNYAFKEACNYSILGLAAVTCLNVTLYEFVTRLLSFVPVTLKTKKQMEDMDYKNLHRTGISGAVYRKVSKWTGKKPLTMRVNDNKKAAKEKVNDNEKVTNNRAAAAA